jgi:glucokinase
MAILSLDLGGTKLAAAIFTDQGITLWEKYLLLELKQGAHVGELVKSLVEEALSHKLEDGEKIEAIGVAVPGISFQGEGTVYAPNIPGWERYPLRAAIEEVAVNMPIYIESDRSCYIMGERWLGAAKGSENAIFMAVGTGIGAGILANGKLIRGSGDVAGAIGWMALNGPYDPKYKECGCFETYASGAGIKKIVQQYLNEEAQYEGYFADPSAIVNTQSMLDQYGLADAIATKVLDQAIRYWGMAVANMVSIFNPEKIIFGGGVFGAAATLMPAIQVEAEKWAQPISMKQVELCISQTGNKTGLFGAAYLAKSAINNIYF